MNITIIDGTPSGKWDEFRQALSECKDALSANHEVDLFPIAEMNIKYCTGCFGCWVKTPGECHLKDEAETVMRSVFKNDLVIFASPLVAGLISAETKKIMDRMLPKVMPYIGIYHGESHHDDRYQHDFAIALMVFDDGTLDDEAVDINFDIFKRFKLNFHANEAHTMVAASDGVLDAVLEVLI